MISGNRLLSTDLLEATGKLFALPVMLGSDLSGVKSHDCPDWSKSLMDTKDGFEPPTFGL